jgi:tape measure domain-containing protein
MSEKLNVGSVEVKLTADSKGLDSSLDSAQKKVGKLSAKFDDSEKAAGKWGKNSSNAATKASQVITKANSDVVSSTKKVDKGFRRYSAGANAATASAGKLKKGSEGLSNSINETKNRLFSFNSVATAVASSLATNQIIAYGDAYKSAQNQIRQTTETTEELGIRTEQLFTIAERSRVGIKETAELYTQLNLSTKDLNLSTKQQLRLVETINKSFAVSGKSAAESAGAIRQLGQAFSSGALRGEEFNSIAEGAPEIMRALQKSLGKTAGELRKFAATGGITSEILVKALENYSSVVDSKLSKSTKTFAQQAEIAKNNMTKFVGESKALAAVGETLGAGLVSLSESLDDIANFAVVAGTAYAASFTPAIIGSTVAMFKGTATANIYTGAITRVGVHSAAAAVAVKGLSASVAALGGPIGIAITALVGLLMMETDAEKQASKTAAAHNKLTDSFKKLDKESAEKKLAEYSKKIEDTESKIKSLQVEANAATKNSGMGLGSVKAAAQISQLNGELKNLIDAKNKLLGITADPIASIGESAEKALVKLIGLSDGLSGFINLAASGFDEAVSSAKEMGNEFRKYSLKSITNQVTALESRIESLKEVSGESLLGFVLTKEQQEIKTLTQELERLKKIKESLTDPKDEKEKQKSIDDAKIKEEERLFALAERNKTEYLKIENAERAKLNKIAKDFNSGLYLNELEEMKAISDRMLEEEKVRLETNRKLLDLAHKEELSDIKANERLKGEMKATALAEANKRYIETVKAFDLELQAEIEDSTARMTDIQRDFLAELASGKLSTGLDLNLIKKEKEALIAASIEILEFKKEQDRIELENKKTLIDSKIELEKQQTSAEIERIKNDESVKGDARIAAITEAQAAELEAIRAFEEEKALIQQEALTRKQELDQQVQELKIEQNIEQKETDLEDIFNGTESILEAMGMRFQSQEDQELEHLARQKAINDEALEAGVISEKEHAAKLATIKEQESKLSKQKAINDAAFALNHFSSNSKKVTKILEAAAVANAVKSGYESAVHAWKSGMSQGGPWVAAAYTAASLAKTGALIGQIKSSSSSQSSSGGGGVPSVNANTGSVVGGGQSEAVNRNISVNIVGEGIMSTEQVRSLIGQINEQVGDGVEIRTNTGG